MNIVINALGVLDNPNLRRLPEGDTRQAMAYTSTGQAVDVRALADARASGLTAVNITMGHVAGSAEPFEATVADIAAWDAFIRTRASQLRKVHAVADIDAARACGQIGVIYGFQNTEMLGGSTDRVALFAGLGVRVIQLTYNGRNAVGCGATVPDDTGLTPFGAEVVQRLQHEGVLVDLSHSSERTCLDALRLARRPLAITHTGCRAVADHPRNKSDAELRALAAQGGVVGLYCMPYLRLAGQPLSSDLIAHLEHALDVCGDDHVGLGTDGGTTAIDDMAAYRTMLAAETALRRRMGIGAPGESADVSLFLPDLCGPTQFVELAERLALRGHSGARIDKILGGNFRRVMRDAWG